MRVRIENILLKVEKMQSLKKLTLALFFVLIPFQDSSLQNSPIGFLGASPAFIPLIILFSITLVEWLWFRNGQINKKLLLIVAYMSSITGAYLILFGTESHNTNLIAKSIKLSILTLLSLFPVFYIDYKKINISKYVFISFLIGIVGIVFIDVVKISSLETLFHATPNKNMRPRGFALESSTLSAFLITTGLLSISLAKTKFRKIIIAFLSVSAVIYSGSKGGLLILIVSLLLVVVIIMKNQLKFAFFIIPVTIIVLYTQSDILIESVRNDIQNYTSIATRGGLLFTSIITLYNNPFGVGFSGFLPAISKYGLVAIDLMKEIFGPRFYFAEIMEYINASSDASVSTKTFFTDYVMYFGLPFIFLFFFFHIRLIKALLIKKQFTLVILLISCLITICTYNHVFGLYNISLAYGVAYYTAYKHKNINSISSK